ncbi:Nose resistant to fluoxetine protein 6-like 7 [Homarus americanus]|uniref:Nose resistant to fluoxetine protein 6-like 7 n=1 Tax=Homarus americanus TaxID=6706 RepID=A0A8J5JX34_HOMAM|nr:Nose resistant to fluoxetine protein 6-like 7 [Homarus americanus]
MSTLKITLILLLYFIFLIQCHDLNSAVPGDLYAQVKSNWGAGKSPETRGEEGSSQVSAGDDPMARQENLEEISRLKRVLMEDLEAERRVSGFTAHLPGSRRSTLTKTRWSFIDLAPFYLPDPAKVNPECRRDILALYTAIIHLDQLIKNGTLWPLKLVDSWGKSADGVLVGNLKIIGFLNECVNIEVQPESLSLDPDLQDLDSTLEGRPQHHPLNTFDGPQRGENASSDVTYTSSRQQRYQETEPAMPSISTRLPLSLAALFYYSTCIPSTCTSTELKHIQFLSQSASCLEANSRDQPMSVRFTCRFLSITWVVMGHQYLYSAQAAQNPLDIVQMSKAVGFQIIGNGDLSVDTFFFMSGLLVSLGVLRQYSTTGRFNAPLYYIHRVIRLLPPIAVTVALMATLSGLVVGGPLSRQYTTYYLKGCRHSWWMDLTFSSNFIFPHLAEMGKTDEGSTCLPHCWFVAVDMQLYLVTPLVLLPLLFRPKHGKCQGCQVSASGVSVEASLEYNYKVYLTPWCRAGPYMVGILTGYLLHRGRETPSLTRLQWWQVAAGWAAAVAVALAVLLGIERYNFVGTTTTVPQMSLTEAVLYGGAHRAAWAAAVSWMVVACHWGYGGPVDWLLSHPSWQPLSRLTYCIYLTSLPIQFMFLYSIPQPTYYSHITKIMETCGVMLGVSLVAVVITLLSESPILRLEKLLLQPSRPTNKRENTSGPKAEDKVDLQDVMVDAEGVKQDVEDVK